MEGPVRTHHTAPHAAVQDRFPAGGGHGAQEEGVGNQSGGTSLFGEGPKGADGEAEQSGGRSPLLARESLRGLQDHTPRGVRGVVGHERTGQRLAT